MQSILKASNELSGERPKFELHEACRNGNTLVVENLLKADPASVNKKDDDERLPIHWAVSHGHIEIVKLLLDSKKFEDVDVKDGSGWTPLMIAANLKDGEDAVKLLLGKGADVNEKNNAGQTAIFFAVSKNNRDTVDLLFNAKPAASIRVRDKRGQYPIHRAASNGYTPMVELMLKHNSPLNATDVSGYTPLHHAIAEGHGDTALALLKAGAETDKKNTDGNLAIDLAPDMKVKKFIKEAAEREGLEI